MTIIEAINARHTVRSYTARAIPQAVKEQLTARIGRNNEKYGLHMQLVVENTEAFGAFSKLLLAKGVRNYIVLAGENSPNLDEKLGYCGADVMLYAQTLGLNTWWVGGTFSKKGVQKNASIKENERLIGVLAVGYGATQGVPHRSKGPEEISFYKGVEPEWFTRGVQAVLLAPTALNKQAFAIAGDGDAVSITCDNGRFSGVDLGIAKYHFEAGAGKERFRWVKNPV